MTPAQVMLCRRRYHLMWMAKYSLAALVCFALSLVGWPRFGGWLAFVAGYAFTGMASREKRRAYVVLPW